MQILAKILGRNGRWWDQHCGTFRRRGRLLLLDFWQINCGLFDVDICSLLRLIEVLRYDDH